MTTNSKMNITRADTMYAGDAYHEGYNGGLGRAGVELSHIYVYNPGALVTADADGYVASQNLTAAGVFSVNTTAAAAIAAAALAGTADVPRNVVAAWTGTAVITITGTDFYGNTMVESSASGTSLTGKKAFKTVTGVSVSADVTGLTVGTGTVIGMPFRIRDKGDVFAVLDGANVAATVVAGVTTDPATATTGDTRGTVAPGTAPDGTRSFSFWIAVDHTSELLAHGVAQYAG